jgi:hypothetical protein
MTTRTAAPFPGARELHLCDWPFGGVGRRLLLEGLLIDEQPDDGWTKGELETRASVTNGGLKTVLPGAVQIGLVGQGDDGRWHVPRRIPAIAAPLRRLTLAVVQLGEEPIAALETRDYQRHPK